MTKNLEIFNDAQNILKDEIIKKIQNAIQENSIFSQILKLAESGVPFQIQLVDDIIQSVAENERTKLINQQDRFLLRSLLHFLADKFTGLEIYQQYFTESIRLEIIKLLIEKYQADIKLTDIDGYETFHLASINGYDEIVRYLLREAGQEINSAGKIEQQSEIGQLNALYLAVRANQLKVTETLLDYDSDLECLQSDPLVFMVLYIKKSEDRKNMYALLYRKFSKTEDLYQYTLQEVFDTV